MQIRIHRCTVFLKHATTKFEYLEVGRANYYKSYKPQANAYISEYINRHVLCDSIIIKNYVKDFEF